MNASFEAHDRRLSHDKRRQCPLMREIAGIGVVRRETNLQRILCSWEPLHESSRAPYNTSSDHNNDWHNSFSVHSSVIYCQRIPKKTLFFTDHSSSGRLKISISLCPNILLHDCLSKWPFFNLCRFFSIQTRCTFIFSALSSLIYSPVLCLSYSVLPHLPVWVERC